MNAKKNIKPKTYYEELAELGVLEEMLSTRFKFSFENDDEFRIKMLKVLYERSEEPVSILDKLYLEKLNECLNVFLEYTRTWTTQKR